MFERATCRVSQTGFILNPFPARPVLDKFLSDMRASATDVFLTLALFKRLFQNLGFKRLFAKQPLQFMHLIDCPSSNALEQIWS